MRTADRTIRPGGRHGEGRGPWGLGGARPAVQWPTIAVALAIYLGFGTLSALYHALPWWLVAPLGGFLLAWHGSLQHEVVHGHPTPWPRWNEALVFPSLWLWLPFRIYRELHWMHHNTPDLTDPERDPESFYLTPEAWQRAGPALRALLRFHDTALGRLVVGPPLAVLRVAMQECRRLARGDARHLRAWGLHVLGAAVVLAWVVVACGIPVREYLLLFVYPGIAFTLLRSFDEHRAAERPAERCAIIEAGPLMSLLYLNNNLHALHHEEPWLPWHALPSRYRSRREALLAANGGYLHRGYGALVRRHLLVPRGPVAHPALAMLPPARREPGAAPAPGSRPAR